MPKVLVLKTVAKPVSVAGGVVVLLATTAAAPGPGASSTELMMYSYGCAATVIAFLWIAVKLWRQIVQTTVVLAILLTFYLLAKIVVEAVLGA